MIRLTAIRPADSCRANLIRQSSLAAVDDRDRAANAGVAVDRGFQNVRAVDLAAAERYLAILEYHEQR